MGDTVTMTWRDGRGKIVDKEVKLVADARKLIGTSGYAWVIMAANPSLSSENIWQYLDSLDWNGAGRGISWLKRRRWMFRPPGERCPSGIRANADGQDQRAFKIMREHPSISIRQLVYVLKERRISRSREWVRQHRCDPVV